MPVNARPAVPSPRVADPLRTPLSSAQRRLWYMDQLEPGNVFYNVTIACRLDGVCHAETLLWVLRRLVERHAILRTRYPVADGQPFQEVMPPTPCHVRHIIRLTSNCESYPSEIQRFADRIARRKLDLTRGPVFQAELLTLAPDCHALVLLTHHIAIDQQSINVLMEEIELFYEARLAGLEPPLPEAPSYADFTRWHALRIARRDTDLRGYWARHLQTPPRPLPLPPASGTEAGRSGRELMFRIGPAETERLRALCVQTRTTPFMVLLSLFSALLYRYTRRPDFFIGTTIAFRKSRRFERVVGCFINTVALPMRVGSADRFETLLARTRAHVLETFEHHELPYDALVHMARDRHPATTPDFANAYFQFQTARLRPTQAGLNRFSPNIHVHNGRAKFPLMLNASDAGSHIACTLEYEAERFGNETIALLRDDLMSALKVCLRDPSTAIGQLELAQDTRGWTVPQIDCASDKDSEQFKSGEPPSLTETRLAQLWFDILGVKPDRPSDSFYRLGGHSLLIAQLAWRIRQDLGVGVRLSQLHHASTLGSMAELLDRESRAEAAAPPVSRPASSLIMIGGVPCQLELGLWSLAELEALIEPRQGETPGNRLIRLAWAFAGSPFQFETRRPLPLPGRLPVRFGAFDCFTFVLTVLALAEARDIGSFCRNLALLRYRNADREVLDSHPETGTIFDFAEEALLVNAVERGSLRDVTEEVAAGFDTEYVETRLLPVRRNDAVDPMELWATPKLGDLTVAARFISRSGFGCVEGETGLRAGDVILMSRGVSEGGRIIDHVGFVDMDNEQAHLLQCTRHFAYHPPLPGAPNKSTYTGIFYDSARRQEQIGVGVAGSYLGDDHTIQAGGMPVFGYVAGEKRSIKDYLDGTFSRFLVLRPHFSCPAEVEK